MTDAHITVLDGAMGHELTARGQGDAELWSARVLVDAPDSVAALHLEYLDAGVDVITTNTYACVPLYLERVGWEHRLPELLETAGTLAGQARHDSGRDDVRIAGSLPPLGESYQPELAGRPSELTAWYRTMVELLEPHVDLFLLETMTSTAEITAAARAVDSRPLWVSMVADEHDATRLPSGEPIDAVAHAVSPYAPAALLINCCAATTVDAALPRLHASFDGPVGAYGNAFAPRPVDFVRGTDPEWLASPEDYRDAATRWIVGGATIVGGCCGVGPAHLRAVAASLR